MYLPDEAGGTWPTFTYHMFFQSNNPGQSSGSIWGHASSHNLVEWHRHNRTEIRGSSGGGVSLPQGTTDHPDWRGAAFASVPLFPPHSPPVGLSLWISKDKNLSNWELYDFGACLGTLGDDTAVICPEIVPNETRAGYIGDNYVWKETTADGAVIFYVLSGSNKCPEGMWCGYGAKNSTAQGLLFRCGHCTSRAWRKRLWPRLPLSVGRRKMSVLFFPASQHACTFELP